MIYRTKRRVDRSYHTMPQATLQEAQAHGDNGCLRSVADLQFLHDVMHMRLDRLDADRELFGDGAVGQADGEQAQHLTFACGQHESGLRDGENSFDGCTRAGLAADVPASPGGGDALAHIAQAEM